ncbi:MAG TPA: ferritin-like domain-containing protein [Geminicoccaceae bacterium]|nr:ferritin-like domain-containing protein [Geminicoccaceae bacterium]
MPINTMQDLFVHSLRDMYHAEKQLVRAMPKMAKAAQHQELRQAIEEHLEQTKNQVERLNQVFEAIDVAARGVRCEAIEGLVEEAKETMDEVQDPEVRDVAIIVAAQKVEHYEIAAYGSLRTMAEMLGHTEAAQLLEQTLEEEKQTDQKLNQLALSRVNKDAASGGRGGAKRGGSAQAAR